MTKRGRPAAERRRSAAGAEPAEPESKEQKSVEKTAANNPEYTWSQTADEVTFKMPVRLQQSAVICYVRRVTCLRWWDNRSLHVALHSTLHFVALCNAPRHHHLTLRHSTTRCPLSTPPPPRGGGGGACLRLLLAARFGRLSTVVRLRVSR